MADRDILPDNFKPHHYDLLIAHLDFKEWTFKGVVKISGELVKPTSAVTLNALEIKLTKASLATEHTKASQVHESSDFAYEARKQRVTVAFAHESPASPRATLTLDFDGKINHDMAGFYRSQYTPAAPAAASVPREGDLHFMTSTQFEACDARRAFPCFDEPNLKATFDVALEVPADLVALGNMPVRDETPAPGGRDGWKLVSFERTPVMSTYLLAWAVGDFEYVEALTERRYGGRQVPVRVYTTRGLKEQGRWALEHAPKYIDFFSERFEIDYPLPKSDILAVHEFSHSAMENWGLVTYRTSSILFDDTLSDTVFRNRIAYVVAHELAHMWFGDLVTMDWWDELWLNEGFATWAGWLATESLHPDWDVWVQFVNEGMETALKLDAVRSSHPIHVPVRDALDINQVFDAISYLKGCSVIRMLANHLGIATFLRGIALYLAKHKYANAKTDALWAALTEASGQDVAALMAPWIEAVGHPVLRVTEQPDLGQITVAQSRFLSTGDVVAAKEDATTWWLPLALVGRLPAAGGPAQPGKVEALALTRREDVIRGVDLDFYKINSDATGFYRVNYPPARLATLATQLARLTTEDKIAVAGSAAVLAFAGETSTPALLSFLAGFAHETHFRVLSQALDALATLKGVFGHDARIFASLQAFTLRLIDAPLRDVGGWEFPAGEDYNTALLRKRLLVTAGENGHAGVVAEALARFAAYKADPRAHPLHSDLRLPVFRAALKADPGPAVAFLKNEWRTTAAPDGRMVCLSAMASVSDPAVVDSELLPWLLGLGVDSVPAADLHILASALAHNRAARPLLWDRLRRDWDAVLAKAGGNPVVLDRLVKVSLDQFADADVLAQIDQFFTDKDTSAFNRTLETVKDAIRGRAAYSQRDATVLREWLVANGY